MFCKERSERIRNTPWEMPGDAMAGELCEDAGDGWKLHFRGSLSGLMLSLGGLQRERERQTDREGGRRARGIGRIEECLTGAAERATVLRLWG